MKFSWRTFSIYPCTMTVKLCHHVSDVLAFLFIKTTQAMYLSMPHVRFHVCMVVFVVQNHVAI